MNQKPHPAQLLFSEKHPLTAEFGMKFCVDNEDSLRIEVDAPKSFLDACKRDVNSLSLNSEESFPMLSYVAVPKERFPSLPTNDTIDPENPVESGGTRKKMGSRMAPKKTKTVLLSTGGFRGYR